jgi:RNA polymerase sigma-70 factor, ECF subfamily
LGYTGTILINNSRILDQDQLLARAHKLDAQALAEIHDMYYPLVYRYVNFRMDDTQVVEDISAEVFLRLLDNLHRGTSQIRDMRAWLIGTANNLINDHLRRKYRKPLDNLEDHETLPFLETPELSAIQSEHRHEIRQAVQRLTAEQRSVLSLRFALECSLEETAQMMNKSVGAIKTLQFRALAALRKTLEGK